MVDNDEILVSHEYKGVFKIKVNKNLTKALEVVKDTSIEKGLTSSLIKYRDTLYYAYKKGVFKFDKAPKVF